MGHYDAERFRLRMPNVELVIEDGERPTERYPDGFVILRLEDQTGPQDVNLSPDEAVRIATALLERANRLRPID